MLKDKDIYTFVRFGGLNLKKQKDYTSTLPKPKPYDMNWMHLPPASRGIYAMPKVAQELFLVGSLDSFQHSVMPKEREYAHLSSDDKVKAWDNESKRRREVLSMIRKEFRKDSGTVWHHLGDCCKRSEILAEHGAWVKTEMAAWAKAFRKASVTSRAMTIPEGDHWKNKMFGCHGHDHLEVFFDEKV